MKKDLQEITDLFREAVYENETEYLKNGVLHADRIINQQLWRAIVLRIWKMLPKEKIYPKHWKSWTNSRANDYGKSLKVKMK